MSEDEIIERVNKFINITVLYGKTYGMTCDDLKKYQQVFQGLLDLYQQEKDSNQWLLKAFDESRNNNIELSKEYCKIQKELQQEKEKNKELEKKLKVAKQIYNDSCICIATECVEKDKIRAKIEELDALKHNDNRLDRVSVDFSINKFKELLED